MKHGVHPSLIRQGLSNQLQILSLKKANFQSVKLSEFAHKMGECIPHSFQIGIKFINPARGGYTNKAVPFFQYQIYKASSGCSHRSRTTSSAGTHHNHTGQKESELFSYKFLYGLNRWLDCSLSENSISVCFVVKLTLNRA